jgi:DUF1009 family protein
MSVTPPSKAEGPLALVCGGGSLPLAVADLVAARGRKVLLFPLHGAADPQSGARYPHHWLYLGQLGKFSRLARAAVAAMSFLSDRWCDRRSGNYASTSRR